MILPAINTTHKCLREYESQKASTPVLVCFPHAGGAASAFYPFVSELTQEWHLLIAQYSGRGSRYSEPLNSSLMQTVEEITHALKDYQNRELIFFGHSMGAKIAFEVAASLHHKPKLLIASCSPPPDRFSGHRPPSHDYSDAVLSEYLRSLGGTVADLLENKEIMELVLPIIRADFQSLNSYTSSVINKRVDVPIIGLVADQDTSADSTLVQRWKNWTSRGYATLSVTGNHFYFQNTEIGLAAYIQRALQLLMVDNENIR